MGPLQGLKVIEMAGIGPSQLCGMLLADMGADVIRIRRPGESDPGVAIPDQFNLMNRSRPTIVVDLKSDKGIELVLRLCEEADAIIEGFRPGVMEKLGLGPADCAARNRRIVFGRITGWGQTGPLAEFAGHDTNYIALGGALGGIGERGRPPPVPLNLIADFGGGALYLAVGLLAAILEARESGEGQVVDAAMVDGVASMLTLFYGLMAGGMWTDDRQSNLLDGGAPFVRCYEARDGKYVAVCAIEQPFYQELLERLGITEIDAEAQYDTSLWPEQERIFARVFKTKTRDEWGAVLEGSDACAAGVLSMGEAPQHRHNIERETFIAVDGIVQPAPAPRFSRTASEVRYGPAEQHDEKTVLRHWGLADEEITELL
jgi:alpha-methylacyl-CoA racemase